MATCSCSFTDLVNDMLAEVGPAFYERRDLRLRYPVAKDQMTRKLKEEVPQTLGGEAIAQVSDLDGVKYILADDSWLLIRPSGTEPVLRVYAEGRSQAMVKELLAYGETVAASIV